MRVELVGPARENLGFSSSRIPPVKSIISSWRKKKMSKADVVLSAISELYGMEWNRMDLWVG